MSLGFVGKAVALTAFGVGAASVNIETESHLLSYMEKTPECENHNDQVIGRNVMSTSLGLVIARAIGDPELIEPFQRANDRYIQSRLECVESILSDKKSAPELIPNS